MTAPQRRLTLPLDQLSADIRSAWAEAKDAQMHAFDRYLAVGRLLEEARHGFESDKGYGKWFAGQGFGFSTEWGRRLRLLAAHEPTVRALVASVLATGDQMPGVDRMLDSILQPVVTRPLSSGRDPRTTMELLRRVMAYRRDLDDLLEPGAEYVARQIAQVTADAADTPGSRAPRARAEALREEAAAFREIAEAVENLAARLEAPED